MLARFGEFLFSGWGYLAFAGVLAVGLFGAWKVDRLVYALEKRVDTLEGWRPLVFAGPGQ